MIKVEQQHMAVFDEHGDNLQRGDCLTACLASIFELPLDDVPFFVEQDDWYSAYHEWVCDRGLCIEQAHVTVDEDDPCKLRGWPSDRYWIATVKSPRGRARCNVCGGGGETATQWDKKFSTYVTLDAPAPCTYCEGSGLVPSLHAIVMYGREIAWDPHPQRDMGHLGFISGEQFGVPDPVRVRLV